ncbi:DNA cytosine methyltransferase [Stenomitos frigidus]|uniref:DNA (cytosine-5-)-methyltransferase n=1 Tax=Stenomitos frigidus ULC18 TaxID=2107698 RepID=A0A2T1ELX1_9CYAN|nr:DNA cytosine methyltransferase [Stenomitos frigidus]PSB33705.1 DNA cytosine methyltransferase [Stenomitos frigidus ULC18]
MSKPAVPFSTGENVTLAPHYRSCDLEQLRAYAQKAQKAKKPLAIDLFCGAGGLSLGLQEAGFNVILGVDSYQQAAETHKAHFGGVSLCEDLSKPEVIDAIGEALKGIAIALVAGGPPCQPFSQAGKSKIRHLVQEGARHQDDERRELWQSFVAVVERIKPQAVLVENVPDMALGDDAIVLRQLVAALEALNYDVHTRILAAWQYDIPQFRQRLFLVGVRSGTAFKFPEPVRDTKPKLRDAIADLPVVEAGAKKLVIPYQEPEKLSRFQKWCRRGVAAEEQNKLYDHIVRAVREDDLEAFRLMDHQTRYSDLPEALKRYRDDIFDDKYKRLGWDEPSRSITAHLARDGYWYIHPEQHRCLTIREAARIQSFPDWYRFCGHPSHAYRQIGGAVPPLLGKYLGKAILEATSSYDSSTRYVSTAALSTTLKHWLEQEPEQNLVAPWRRSTDLWQILLGITLFEKLPDRQVRLIWSTFRGRWADAKGFLKDTHREAAIRAMRQSKLLPTITAVARSLSKKNALDNLELPEVGENQLEMALALADLSHQRPIFAPIYRVAERVFGAEDERSSIGHEQLMVARLVGVDQGGRAYAGVLEVADQFCKPGVPECTRCPLNKVCFTASKTYQPVSSQELIPTG